MAFKTLDWIRSVRDENYEKCKNMSTKEKIDYTKKMAKNFQTYPCKGHEKEKAMCSDVKTKFETKGEK
jgi:hypothetical protein